ncbi:MAG: hypothetical protein ACI9WS_002714, partial [Paraglaciecola psychrophila]
MHTVLLSITETVTTAVKDIQAMCSKCWILQGIPHYNRAA